MSRPNAAQRGQMLPYFALALLPLLAFAAVGVDAGTWRNQQRQQQAATDSAAIAGAADQFYTTASPSPPAYDSAAWVDAARNGFTNGTGGVTITVNDPAASGDYASTAGSVEVIVTAPEPSFFARIFGAAGTISTRAVARPSGASSGNCIYTLDHRPANMQYDLVVTGGISAPTNCNVVDDGKWNMTGGTVAAKRIGVAGAIVNTGGTFSEATPTPSTPVFDPCHELPACAYISAHPPDASVCTQTQEVQYSGGTPKTIYPGVYCGGIKVAGGSGTGLTMSPGLYVVETEFAVTGGVLTADGVTVDFLSTSKNVGVNLTGGTTTLTAPTSGNYAGLAIYQPTSTAEVDVTGGNAGGCPISGTQQFFGTVYAPQALVNTTGGNWTPSTVIAGALETTGGSICVTLPADGLPVKHAVLVE